MEEIKGFFILGCDKSNGHPIEAIKKKMAEYDSIPDNAVIFWSGNLATFYIDYRVSWLESGEQVDSIAGASSMIFKDFMPDH